MNDILDIISNFVKYMRRTWVNKVVALTLLTVAYVLGQHTGDTGAFVFLLLFMVPIFFMNESIF